MERDDLLHPLFARRRWVRMNVHSFRHLRIGLSSHHPSTARKASVRQCACSAWLHCSTLTYCEICTDNRPLLRCLIVKYILTYCLNLILGISSGETFDWNEKRKDGHKFVIHDFVLLKMKDCAVKRLLKQLYQKISEKWFEFTSI